MLRPYAVSCLFVGITLIRSAADMRGAEPVVDPQLRSAVRELVEVPWTKTADGLVQADAAYRRAQSLSPSDERLDYAWALMQLRYLRFDEAEKTLTGVIADDADHWDARRLRIRLAAQMKKHAVALDEIDRLSERLTAAGGDAARADELRDGVEFLGRMFAFYQGPAGKGVTQTTVTEVRGRVLGRLTPTERETFSNAYGGVNEQFTQLQAEKERTAETAKQTEQVTKEGDLKRLEAERGAVDADKTALRQQAADAEAKTREAVGKVDGQIAPIEVELTRINTIGAGLRAQIVQLDVSIGSLLAQADRTKDKAEAASLRTQANFLTGQITQLDIQYQVLDGQATQLNIRRNGLLQERQGHVARYEAEMKSLGIAAAQLNKQEKKIAVQTTVALKPATGNTPLVQSQATTAASLGTYIDLSLEREKARLLKAFGL